MGGTDCGGIWVLFSWVMLSKSLIQFSVDGQNCVPSMLLGLRPNYCRDKVMATSFKRTYTSLPLLLQGLLLSVFLTPQETEPDVPVSVQESLEEAWVDSGLPWGQGN